MDMGDADYSFSARSGRILGAGCFSLIGFSMAQRFRLRAGFIRP